MPEARRITETARQSAELAALRRMLSVSRGMFSLSVAVCNSVPLRDYLIGDLQSAFEGIEVVPIPEGESDVFAYVRERTIGTAPKGVFLTDLDRQLRSEAESQPVLSALNASRELWAGAFDCPVVFWVPDFAASLLSIHARDLWAWTSHQFEFVAETEGITGRFPWERSDDVLGAVNLPLTEKMFRIGELEQRIRDARDRPPPSLQSHVMTWLGELGTLRLMRGDCEGAADAFRALLASAREAKNRAFEGVALGDLGLVQAYVGEIRRAIKYFEKALAIRREIGDRRGEGSDLGNLGAAYADMREPRRAIEYCEQALAICREIGDRRGEGSHLGTLGNAYADVGETRRAIEYYEQALAIRRDIGDRRGEGNDLGNMGLAHAALGETRRAIEYYEQALAIHREIGNRPGEGIDMENLGIAFEKLGQIDQARKCWEGAAAIYEEIEDPNAAKVRGWLEGLDKGG